MNTYQLFKIKEAEQVYLKLKQYVNILSQTELWELKKEINQQLLLRETEKH